MHSLDIGKNKTSLDLPYFNGKIPPSLNPKEQKANTYRILSGVYEQKLQKYNNTKESDKKTPEYKRLEGIVFRLRATLTKMKNEMGPVNGNSR